MKMDGKRFLLRIVISLGHALAVIISYLIFSLLLPQMTPYAGDYVNHPLINVLIIGLAAFAFSSSFLQGTVFKYFAEGGRVFFMMGIAIYIAGGGPLKLTVQEIHIEADASIMLALFLLATIIDLARIILSALNFLAEKEKL